MGDMADYYAEQFYEQQIFETTRNLRREFDRKYWTMKDGTPIRYKDMGTDHLMNSISMMERNCTPEELKESVKYKALWRELNRRDG